MVSVPKERHLHIMSYSRVSFQRISTFCVTCNGIVSCCLENNRFCCFSPIISFREQCLDMKTIVSCIVERRALRQNKILILIIECNTFLHIHFSFAHNLCTQSCFYNFCVSFPKCVPKKITLIDHWFCWRLFVNFFFIKNQKKMQQTSCPEFNWFINIWSNKIVPDLTDFSILPPKFEFFIDKMTSQ